MNELIQIYPNIYYIPFDNNQSLGLTFLRSQEHYESPYFKGKIFTLKEYKEWYKIYFETKVFDYCSVYVGFNLPDSAFDIFIQGKFNPLTKNETKLLNMVKELPRPFYIIGINQKSSNADMHLYHEVAHGLYYLSKEYREIMQNIINLIPKDVLREIKEELATVGYHKDMFFDEIQAYLVDKDTGSFFDIDDTIIKDARNHFKKYCDYQTLAKNIGLVYT